VAHWLEVPFFRRALFALRHRRSLPVREPPCRCVAPMVPLAVPKLQAVQICDGVAANRPPQPRPALNRPRRRSVRTVRSPACLRFRIRWLPGATVPPGGTRARGMVSGVEDQKAVDALAARRRLGRGRLSQREGRRSSRTRHTRWPIPGYGNTFLCGSDEPDRAGGAPA